MITTTCFSQAKRVGHKIFCVILFRIANIIIKVQFCTNFNRIFHLIISDYETTTVLNHNLEGIRFFLNVILTCSDTKIFH